jgi:hypothetical protein
MAYVDLAWAEGNIGLAQTHAEYSEGGKLIDKTKNDEDGEPCMED